MKFLAVEELSKIGDFRKLRFFGACKKSLIFCGCESLKILEEFCGSESEAGEKCHAFFFAQKICDFLGICMFQFANIRKCCQISQNHRFWSTNRRFVSSDLTQQKSTIFACFAFLKAVKIHRILTFANRRFATAKNFIFCTPQNKVFVGFEF